jgi:two-component sensor histidine kinase
LACALVAALFRLAHTPLAGWDVPFFTFSPAVLIAAILGGLLSGFASLILTSLIAADLWLGPMMHPFGEPFGKVAAFWLFCCLLIVAGAWLRSSIQALTESEEQATILAFEMTHRVRNVIGLVQAISRQTSRNSQTFAEYQTMFEGRLTALGRAQDLIADNPNVPTDLRTLLDRILEPFGPARFKLSGSPIGVPRQAGSTLALLFHELGTNSLKYGALSVPEGCISISWASEQQNVRLNWREINGPPVAAPSKTGFGSKLLKTAFPPGRGDATVNFEPEGVQCRVSFPAAAA